MENSAITEVGAVSILGTAFILLMRWMMTQMTRELRTVGQTLTRLSLIQLDLHKTLIVHDAQVRGVNPSAGKDATDAHQIAANEYKRVLSAIEATKNAIMSGSGNYRSESFDTIT